MSVDKRSEMTSSAQVAVVLIFLTAIILYRTILSIIIYKSEYSFFSFSVSKRQLACLHLGPQSLTEDCNITDAITPVCVCVFRLGE